MKTNTLTPLIATFRPQAWINDQAVDIDGKIEFDATDQFLSLNIDQIHFYRENCYSSDFLADNLNERIDHSGPFEVDAFIDDWLEENGFVCHDQLTQKDLDNLRAKTRCTI